jgi:hypothetical protein
MQAIRSTDEGHAAGHAGAEIVADRPEDHRRAAGHVLAAVGAAAFDHRRARVAHGEALAGLARREQLAGGGAIEHGVADDRVVLAFSGETIGRTMMVPPDRPLPT